jgi:hypothetical protein
MTVQEQMTLKLSECGIPAKEIKCYGSQIMITALSKSAAEKWVSLLSQFARIRGVTESTDYCKENRNTVLLPSTVKVWRVWATV